jgi:hypothetical protein
MQRSMTLHDSELPVHQLFVRHVRKDDRPVASLRALDQGEQCVVEVSVYPTTSGGLDPMSLGPYSFESLDEAVRFAEEALLALEYLGCTVHSGQADELTII